MSTHQNIRNAAIRLFAANGFDGTSIDEIAKAVGIRKASLYSHIAGKEELYKEVFQEVLRWDIEYFRNLSKDLQGRSTEEKLHTILLHYCQIYTDETKKARSLFLNRTMLFPPDFLSDQTRSIFENYEKTYDNIVKEVMEEGIASKALKKADVEELLAFLYCIIDGLFMQSCYYSPEEFHHRFNAVWSVFWQSIRSES